MAIGSAVGAVTKGLPLAIGAANKVFTWVTKILGVASAGLDEVNAARMSPEEYAAAMEKVVARLAATDEIIGPLRQQMKDKQAEVDGGWDDRLD